MPRVSALWPAPTVATLPAPNAGATMRIRSALLVACMVVVPMIAMFSHRVPPAVRAAIRDVAWDRLVSAVMPAAATKPAAEPPTGTASTPPAAPANSDPPGSDANTVAATAVTAPVPVAAPVAGRADAACRDAETRLTALGAMAIECHPMPGVDGHHAASCRVAIDATGQLHRLFQASGNGPADAMSVLLADVAAWRQRFASRAGGSEQRGAGVPRQAGTMNF